MVTTIKRNDSTIVLVNGVEVGYVKKSNRSGWFMAATQTGNYAHDTGFRTKAIAVAALARTAK